MGRRPDLPREILLCSTKKGGPQQAAQVGDFQPAIAIKAEVVGQFHSVTRTVSMQFEWTVSSKTSKMYVVHLILAYLEEKGRV